MRLKNYLTEEIPFQIFVDMDDTLSDFKASFKNFIGKTTEQVEKETDDEGFWKLIAEKGGLLFWSQMPWMKGSQKLWKYVKQFHPTILTAPARSLPESKKGKQIWVLRELGPVPIIFERGRDKHRYAGPNRILVDDSKKIIKNWNRAGGIGIRFKSPEQAIKELKKIIE